MPRMKMSDLDVYHKSIDRIELGKRLADAVDAVDHSMCSLVMIRGEAKGVTLQLAIDRVIDLVRTENAKVCAVCRELRAIQILPKPRKKRRKKRAAE